MLKRSLIVVDPLVTIVAAVSQVEAALVEQAIRHGI